MRELQTKAASLWVLALLGLSSEAYAECPGHSAITINEFLADPSGSDGSVLEEWVELYNSGSLLVDLSGWTIERAKNTSSLNYSTRATLGGTISPGAYFVVGELNVVGADFTLSDGEKLDLGNASNTDALRIVDCEGIVSDTVLYGSPNEGADSWEDDSGSVATDDTLAPSPSSDKSLARRYDGNDTNNSSLDFCLSESPDPGGPNDCAESQDTGDTGGGDTGDSGEWITCDERVVINELLIDPEGSDSSAFGEWVELYNADVSEVDLSGWTLERAKSSYSTVAELSGILAPGDYYTIAESGADIGADLVLEEGDKLDLGNAGSSADAVRLRCTDGVADTVLYGDPNSDEFRDDSGAVADSLAEGPGETECLARVEDGYDTDACGVDLQIAESENCSPGEANPVVEPPVCEVDGAPSIKINEIMPDPDGTDGGREWLELVNTGAETRLDGWMIDVAKSEWGSIQYTFPNGTVLAAGGLLLLADTEVADADFYAEGLSMGNAGSNADGVRLVDCEGSVVDTVIYGLSNDDGLVDDSGGIATTLAPIPESDEVLFRYPDGADSDDHAEDWKICATASPGAANGECSTGGGNGGKDPGSCGCRNEDLPEGEDPSNSCATTGPIGGLEWLVLALVAWRRRED